MLLKRTKIIDSKTSLRSQTLANIIVKYIPRRVPFDAEASRVLFVYTRLVFQQRHIQKAIQNPLKDLIWIVFLSSFQF